MGCEDGGAVQLDLLVDTFIVHNTLSHGAKQRVFVQVSLAVG